MSYKCLPLEETLTSGWNLWHTKVRELLSSLLLKLPGVKAVSVKPNFSECINWNFQRGWGGGGHRTSLLHGGGI